MPNDLEILVKLAVCLVAALICGYVTQRARLSPIIGYLIAGIVVGPRTPGFVANQESANQFAELGIILLMFGVGLHFNLRDLFNVRRIALPGAIGQMSLGVIVGTTLAIWASWNLSAALVVGISVSVASTVVLTRLLTEHDAIHTEQGHIAVGWLVVQDVCTVFVLVIIPAAATALKQNDLELTAIGIAVGAAILKIAVLTFAILWGGRKVVPYLLGRVARTRTRELFTLAVLATALTIATGSACLFGVSMALGAFLAGMTVGQSELCHQAAADALPMRDAFAVLFFVSIGMLFDPQTAWQNLPLFAGLMSVIMVANPIAAFAIVWGLGYSVRAGLTVAVGIAQIGEFSFILASLASEHALLPEEGQSLLVACSIASIAINPLLFRSIGPFEARLRRRRKAWRFLSARAELRVRRQPAAGNKPDLQENQQPRAIVVGYGPVGKTAASILREFDIHTVIVDLNIDTVTGLAETGQEIIYGDASSREILEAAGIRGSQYLLVTIPDPNARTVIVIVAKELNPALKVFVRARYLGERAWLEEIGATEICFEEAEAAAGLAAQLLREVGADEARIQSELRRRRTSIALQSTEKQRGL